MKYLVGKVTQGEFVVKGNKYPIIGESDECYRIIDESDTEHLFTKDEDDEGKSFADWFDIFDDTLTMNKFEQAIHTADFNNYRFFGILVEMEGFPKPEVIINEQENFQDKLEYYLQTYDENLHHKFAKVKIIGYAFANDFDTLQADLID
ncbi:hypothetical protein M5X00_26225 [Paenibacillus alvei]|uniref:hypothetical protein n=1 Tax=Paenibacillus alvei TaxID=44250 RepID=UPI00028A2EED|nr:hypothetical protein [Paenibacillus alvei]EJW14103.1 hypothetical protein PAV_141p02090 [Paenibacillus alvei DSM 29]MCY9545028.1 hypothetical protein [Paenibacillus alvei]MCY9707748.1 hypothetical protein [Paenibacillus alvei]MCY9757729.1 hypothetical protein [Paenibacillus alvei]MEC0082739.1 hypothetical protein [Paenibacillus alvei]